MPDIGHEKLLEDVSGLLKMVQEFEFHDFKNKTFDTPKATLIRYFNEFAENVRQGRYDNKI
jgi:hypothetical protein